jgi:hypothetical protein
MLVIAMLCVRVWIAFHDTGGYVLEQEEGFVSYETRGGRVVPAFSTPENAALFAQQRGWSVETELGSHHELAPLVSFAESAREAAPERAFDDWILLDEIAFAARPEAQLASPHDHVEGLRADAAADARDGARAAIRETLAVAREVLAFLDTCPEGADTDAD